MAQPLATPLLLERLKMHITARGGGQAGYSLIELMLVVGVMGVLTSMAVIQVGSSRQGE